MRGWGFWEGGVVTRGGGIERKLKIVVDWYGVCGIVLKDGEVVAESVSPRKRLSGGCGKVVESDRCGEADRSE